MREATPPHLFTRCRAMIEPDAFQHLETTVQTFTVSRACRMLALNMLTIVRIHTGQPIMDTTAVDFDEVVQEWRRSGRMIHSVPLSWQLLQRAGGLRGEAADFRSRSYRSQRTVEELVARRGVKSTAVAGLFVEYLSERAAQRRLPEPGRSGPDADQGLLGRHRTATTPASRTWPIPAQAAAAWKQRLRYLPDGRERADYFAAPDGRAHLLPGHRPVGAHRPRPLGEMGPRLPCR